MRNNILILFFCFGYNYSIAQNENDTSNINIGITTYAFAYNTKFGEGSTAIGPSLFLNEDKLAIQIGFLYDFNKYITLEKVDQTNYIKVKYSHFYLPFFFIIIII